MKNTTLFPAAALVLAVMVGSMVPAMAAISDGIVKIGVLNDQSGQFADMSGTGAVLAARMAAEDFGGTVRGAPVMVIGADHQNKPDTGTAILRRWFDVEQVDAVADLPVSSIALAAQEFARQKNRTLLISGGATSDLTGKSCSPVSSQWSDDTRSLAVGTSEAVVKSGGLSWFFLTVDYAFGHAMERDATEAVVRTGGRVIGSVRHPFNNPDFSSFLLQARESGADVIGLANVGGDAVQAIKQAREFELVSSGRRLVGFLMFINDIHSLGLEVAQGFVLSEGFYWDQNDVSRAWSKRFFEATGKMPSKEQAATYAAVMHYLKAIDAVGTDEAEAVNREMRRLPVDYFGRPGRIREDGRVIYDLTLYQVKTPAESRQPWDYYKELRRIEGDEAFRPTGACPLMRQDR